MRHMGDTIAAQATPAGSGGIAILRMSGPDAETILKRVFRPAGGKLIPRMLTYGHAMEGEERLDEVMAVLMPGPASYTREDVAEIHCHGSQTVAMRILTRLMDCGARLAEPGEFTYRAFLGGRVDLSQAEAVMQMIQADSERAMRSALRQMEGGVSSFIMEARKEIVDMLSDLSAAIDFPDEVEEEETAQRILERCSVLIDRLASATDVRQGRLEAEGLRVALCGRPNAGKSSLLNALLGEERAIVTSIAGTTRDALTEKMQIDGYPVVMTDTAGIRETGDVVERIGVDRARKALTEADVRLLLLDGSTPWEEEDQRLLQETAPQILVLSKADLAAQKDAEDMALPGETKVLRVSSVSGEGLTELRSLLVEQIGKQGSGTAVLTQQRHAEAADRAKQMLGEAVQALREGFGTETAAIDLSGALDALGEITGETMNEKVIDRVFEKFCVGK